MNDTTNRLSFSKDKNLERTMSRLSSTQKAPAIGYIGLIMLYLITSVLLRIAVRAGGQISILGQRVPYAQFGGVFSSLANICIILLVVYYKKLGFITSMAFLLVQFPLLMGGLLSQHNANSIPGLFTNIFTVVAIVTLRINEKRTDGIRTRMAEQAVTDVLTGLPNRFACSELIGELIKQGEKFVLVSIDINNFKNINDTMGFDIGNKLLVEIGSKWNDIANSKTTGTQDLIARLSGDEFALIIRNYNSDNDVRSTIEKYEAVMESVINIEGYGLYITASFGYEDYPVDGNNINNMFTYADAAMSEVKRANSSEHIQRFSLELLKIEHTMEIEQKLRTALDNETIFFNLQPQYDMMHKLRGFEALARMKDENGDNISPGEFIPVAEKVGLVDRVDSLVFRKSTEFFGKLIKKYNLDITLSINVSVRHLMKKDFVSEIQSLLESSGVSANNLEIEITESIMIDSVDKALMVIQDLKKIGVKIAIDDFGTGYSSLSYLNKFPADLIKIDKSFIDKMNTGDSSKQYVASIIAIGHIMGFNVISEGVEEDGQLDTLKEIGCDYVQGYIWGRPLSADKVEELVKQTVQM